MNSHKWIKFDEDESIIRKDAIILCYIDKAYTNIDKEYRIKCLLHNDKSYYFYTDGMSQSDAKTQLANLYQKLNNTTYTIPSSPSPTGTDSIKGSPWRHGGNF